MKNTIILLMLIISALSYAQITIKDENLNSDFYKKNKSQDISSYLLENGLVLNIGDSIKVNSPGFSIPRISVVNSFKLISKSSQIYLSAEISPGSFPNKNEKINDLVQSINNKSIEVIEKDLKKKYQITNIAIVDISKKDSVVNILKSYNTPLSGELIMLIDDIGSIEEKISAKVFGIELMGFDNITFVRASEDKINLNLTLQEINKTNKKINQNIKYHDGSNNEVIVNITIDKDKAVLTSLDYKVLLNIIERVMNNARISLKNKATFVPLDLEIKFDKDYKWITYFNYAGQNNYGALKDGYSINEFDRYGFKL